MDNEIKKIVENGFSQVINELKNINETITESVQQINNKLDSINEHVYFINRNTS